MRCSALGDQPWTCERRNSCALACQTTQCEAPGTTESTPIISHSWSAFSHSDAALGVGGGRTHRQAHGTVRLCAGATDEDREMQANHTKPHQYEQINVKKVELQSTNRPWCVSVVTWDIAVKASHEAGFRTAHDRAARLVEQSANGTIRTQQTCCHEPELQRSLSSNCLERAGEQLGRSKTASEEN